MKQQLVQLRKGEYELDFIKNQTGTLTGVSNFANKYGMDVKYIRKVISKDEILAGVTYKITSHDTSGRLQSMLFIPESHFLYFLAKIKSIKGDNLDPNFIKNLIIIYPLFVKELSKRVFVMNERMEQNRTDQFRYNKMNRLRNLLKAEMDKLVKDMKDRNIEGFDFNTYSDGSQNLELNFDDRFERRIIEIEIVD